MGRVGAFPIGTRACLFGRVHQRLACFVAAAGEHGYASHSYQFFISSFKRENAMTYIMVDVEADGPIPGDYSMVAIGAVVVESSLSQTFGRRIKPISDLWIPEALAVSGFEREETLGFEEPEAVMEEFDAWIRAVSSHRPKFVSDNNGFDWQFVNWYFHHFTGANPFGHSSINLGSLYKGLVKDVRKNFKHLRKTRHTHDPVDDAMGNAEALLSMRDEMGLFIKL